MVLPHVLCSKEEDLMGLALSPVCVSMVNTYKVISAVVMIIVIKEI
jgi:hypothetical protein